MRLNILFLIIIAGFSNALASPGYSQIAKVTLNMKNSSLEKVLDEIEKQSEYYFIFNQKQIDVNRVVNIQANNELITNILPVLFKGTDVNFAILDRKILLTTEPIKNDLSATRKEIAAPFTISGLVTDARTGFTLPGVSVVIKGTTIGAVTDANGKYTIEVADKSVILVFTFIGYVAQEKVIDVQTIINVAMVDEAVGLEGIVVTALGIKSDRKALGYSVTQVDAEEISSVKSDNFVTALSGKVAGVQITTVSSQPGSGTRILIRGGSSITGSNQPLFVVNGVPFDAANTGSSSGFADINPNSIESVSILKGAAASALYGSSAANGVVLITLKTGTFDSKPKVTLSHTSSFDQVHEIPLQKEWAQGYMGSSGWVYVDGETSKSSTSWGPRISDIPDAKYYDRWSVFNTGYSMENNVSVSGGNSQSSYYISYGNLNNQGVLEPLKFKRHSLNANTSFKFTSKLKVSSNIMYTNQAGTRLAEGGSSTFVDLLLATPNTWNPYPVYDKNSKIRLFRGGGRNPYLWQLAETGSKFDRDRFVGSVIVEYSILPDLQFRSVTGVSTASSNNSNFYNRDGFSNPEGSYASNEDFKIDLESTEMLIYNKIFGNFNLNAIAGHNIVENSWRGNIFTGTGLVIPGIYNSSNVKGYSAEAFKGKYRAWSLFGEMRIGFKSILYYTITGRNDWVSSIENNFFYPSHSLGFVFSELLPGNNILSFGKARVSYAKVGAPAKAYVTNNPLEVASGVAGDVKWPFMGQMSYLESSTFPNKKLTNEFKNEIEVGTEMRFFKDRLGIDFAYYHNWSDNQIIWGQLLSTTGYKGGWINIGGITHKGVELMLNITPIRTNALAWDIMVNWSKDNSKVDKLGEYDEPIDVGSYGTAIVGQPFPVIYRQGYLRDDQGRMVLDDNPGIGFGRPLADNRGNLILGKTAPDWIGSLRNTLKYKNFSLTAQLDIQKGGWLYSQSDHYLTYYGMAKHQEDRPEDGMITYDGVMGHYDAGTGKVVVTSETPVPTRYDLFWQTTAQNIVEDNLMPKDFVKLRQVGVSYDFPDQIVNKLHLRGLSASFAGRNLWRKFKKGFEGADTEANTSGIDNGNAFLAYSFPSLKTYSFTLTATF